ncbi:MAG: ArnT family glycosyltransferase [Anaerolineae bacterium]
MFWLLAVLPPYYAVHKPSPGGSALAPATISFDPSAIAIATLGRLADLGLLGVTLVVAAAWGSRLGRWLGVRFESGLEQWVLGATLGLGLLGSAIFGLGLVGGFYSSIAYLLLLILGLTAWSEIWSLGRRLFLQIRSRQALHIPWLWAYIGLVGLLSLGNALLPPAAWDALVYHLQGPRLYLETHRLVAVPENFYLNWPAQIEMLFVWGLLLRSDLLAQLLDWIFWPLTAVLLYVLARRTCSAEVGRWAVALWASVPFARELAGIAYVDVGLTCFVLAGVYAFLRWSEQQNPRWLTLSGFFLGLAMATKYTSVLWFGLVALLVVYHGWKHQRHSISWLFSQIVRMAMIAGLPVLPWLIKNWFVTGNPIYPFLFGGVGWNATRASWLTWTGQGYSQSLLDYLALPWLMTVLGISGTGAFDATTGPLLLCLVPWVSLFRGYPRAIRYGLVLAGGQFIFFALLIAQYVYLAQTRLLLSAFPLLCIAGAFVLQHLPLWDRKSFRLSWIVRGLVVLVLGANLGTEVNGFLVRQPLPVLVGLESHDRYLIRRLGAHYEIMSYINNHLPGDTRIFFLWEPRGYYCSRAAQADATLDNLAQFRLVYADPSEALTALRAQGFTHLLFYHAGLAFLQGPTPRPPTLSHFFGSSLPTESYYPIAQADLSFLDVLLDHCWMVKDMVGIYELYRIP